MSVGAIAGVVVAIVVVAVIIVVVVVLVILIRRRRRFVKSRICYGRLYKTKNSH